jgi:hypothetical protein
MLINFQADGDQNADDESHVAQERRETQQYVLAESDNVIR